MFRGSEKGLKEDLLCFFGVQRVRPRVERNHANDAQIGNQGKLWRTLEPIVVSDSMDIVMQPGYT
jgi:hypothetical protein